MWLVHIVPGTVSPWPTVARLITLNLDIESTGRDRINYQFLPMQRLEFWTMVIYMLKPKA